MEEIEEVKQNPQEEQSIEQNPADGQDHEDKVIHMLESSQTQGEMRKGRNQAITETELVNPQAVEEGKVAEKPINLLKKSKQSSKQIPKTKNTVPRPFSLATEKRMNVDRLRSSDVKPSKPTLTKSASLNYKNLARPSLVADKRSDQRPATSTRPLSKPSLKPEVKTDKQVNKKVEKQEGNDVGSNCKLRKTSTFKALPLPSFYHQKDLPPKPEAKKTPVTHSKPPMFGQIRKQAAVPKSKSSKTTEDQKPKRVMRASSFSAKETIRSSLSTTKDIVKSVATCA